MRFQRMTWRECLVAVPIAAVVALVLLAVIGWVFPSILLSMRALIGVGFLLWVCVTLAGLWVVNSAREEEVEREHGWRRNV
jgi:protein-S-isoprenylcysteine O-methyltransferase Ste14